MDDDLNRIVLLMMSGWLFMQVWVRRRRLSTVMQFAIFCVVAGAG